jgi:two-component system NtrC family sensor kinase
MMTGYGSEGTAARALRLGVRDYLIKPFTTEEVLSSIERALEESRLRSEAERLSNLVENYVRCLDLLDTVGSSITSSFDLDDVLQCILEAGQLVTGAESGGLLLKDETSEQLQVVAVLGQPELDAEALLTQAGDERLHPVLQEGVAVRLESAEDHTIENQMGDMATSVLQVPLSMQDRILGLMTIERCEERIPFCEHDEQMLRVLAGYAVIALEKAGRLP